MRAVFVDTLRLVLSSKEFLGALPLAGVIVGVGSGLLVLRRRFPAVPIGGLIFVAAAVFGLRATPVVSDPLVTAIAAFAVAGLIRDVIAVPPYAQVLLALPGSWLVATALPYTEPAWLVPLVAGFLAVGAPLFAAFDRVQVRPPLGPIALAICVGAAYLVLPDTEEVLVLLPIAAAVALCGWPLATMRLGAAGSYAALAVVMAVASWDGRGRPASIIGVVATFAVPVLWPALVGAAERMRPVSTTARTLALLAIHLVVAIVGARVVGIGASVPQATVLAAITVAVTTAVLATFAATAPEPAAN
jgi:hypothetical protein